MVNLVEKAESRRPLLIEAAAVPIDAVQAVKVAAADWVAFHYFTPPATISRSLMGLGVSPSINS